MSDPEPQPEPTEAEIFELRKPEQLAWFADMKVSRRKIVLPAPKAIPAKFDDGTDIDPAPGDVLTVAYEVKLYSTVTGEKFKLIKGQERYTKTKGESMTYHSQYVEGSARIVQHSRPEES